MNLKNVKPSVSIHNPTSEAESQSDRSFSDVSKLTSLVDKHPRERTDGFDTDNLYSPHILYSPNTLYPAGHFPGMAPTNSLSGVKNVT